MNQQQRFILFLVLAMGMLFGWMSIGPRLFPGLFPRPPAKKPDDGKGKARPKKPAGKKPLPAGRLPVEARKPDGAEPPPKVVGPVKKPIDNKPKPVFDPANIPPHEPVQLGSLDPNTGYFMQVQLDPQGASVEWVKLNDMRYRRADDLNEPLKVIGFSESDYHTFDTIIDEVDRQLKKLEPERKKELQRQLAQARKKERKKELKKELEKKYNLRTVNWAVKDITRKDGITTGVTFTFTSPDGTLKLTKRYSLEKVDLSDTQLLKAQNTQSQGYELRFQLTIENRSSEETDVTYQLQGPVGVPLENPEAARTYESFVLGLLKDDGAIESSSKDADDVVEKQTPQEGSIKYVGVGVQYFAALIVPSGDQVKLPPTESVVPEVIEDKGKHSDISLVLTSKEITLKPAGQEGASITHDYTLFAGPKRKALLTKYSAEAAIYYGWGIFGYIAKGMLWLLGIFNSVGAPYWLAIILLTACVRGAMFPLSKKQAKSANKMKELQPKIAELKKKHEGDRENLAKAQMALFAKHGYNPLAGCLPIFMQMPIFIGLYQGLSNTVDLRLAPFLWIENLAAPDALFPLGFALPLVGWKTFNLLPIITIFLFIAQQKMFMPPATDDQTRMQQKMMMYMSVFFGFLFYTVPSGLCLYFIVSSLWGMGERKLLGSTDTAGAAEVEPSTDGSGGGGPKPSPKDDPDKPKGFWGRLMDAADDAAKAKAKGSGNGQSGTPDRKRAGAAGPRKRKKGRKRR